MSTRQNCPHKNIIYCPLYVASHGLGGGCDDGRLHEGGCAVDRGMDYRVAVIALRSRYPDKMEELEREQAIAEAREQIDRNMRLSGVH